MIATVPRERVAVAPVLPSFYVLYVARAKEGECSSFFFFSSLYYYTVIFYSSCFAHLNFSPFNSSRYIYTGTNVPNVVLRSAAYGVRRITGRMAVHPAGTPHHHHRHHHHRRGERRRDGQTMPILPPSSPMTTTRMGRLR